MCLIITVYLIFFRILIATLTLLFTIIFTILSFSHDYATGDSQVKVGKKCKLELTH